MKTQAARPNDASHAGAAAQRLLARGETRAGAGSSSSSNANSNAPSRPPAQQAAHDQFEQALRRHRSEEEALPPGLAEVRVGVQPLALQPAPAALRDAALSAAPTGAGPRTAAAQDSVSVHLRALGAVPVCGTDSSASTANSAAPSSTPSATPHWQVHWAGPSAPVQQLDLQRSESGALHVNLSGGPHASDPSRLARLRERLAARTGSSNVFVQAQRAAQQRRLDAHRHDSTESDAP